MGKNYIWHTCKVCGKEFYATYNRVYCSCECKSKKTVDKEAILDFYYLNKENGMTYTDMAKEFGCSISLFREVCVNAGNKKPLTNKQSKIVSAYKECKSNSDIAKELGIETKNVLQTLKRLGIKENYKKEKAICKECGKEFLKSYCNQLFCSKVCSNRNKHSRLDFTRRIRVRNCSVDKDITLKKVYEINGGVCWICGLRCNYEDFVLINGKKFAKKMYPSVDHVIPLSKGGLHSWSNVKLAHFGCNASKGVKIYA